MSREVYISPQTFLVLKESGQVPTIPDPPTLRKFHADFTDLNLETGEWARNIADGKLWFRDSVGIQEFSDDLFGQNAASYHNHDDLYYTKTEEEDLYYTKEQLSTPSSSEVDWTNLINVQKATISALGVIKVGQYLTIDSNGVLNGQAGGSGGAAIWGQITGSLDDQTDITMALALKAPIESPVFTTKITSPLIYGGSAINGNITISGTSNATKTTNSLFVDETTLQVRRTGNNPSINVKDKTPDNLTTIGIASVNTAFSSLAVAGDTIYRQYLGNTLFVNRNSATAAFKWIHNTANGQPEIEDARLDINGNLMLGFTSSSAKFSVNGGLHVGGTTDPGDNNMMVDGDLSSPTFFSGFTGTGWKLDETAGIYTLTVDNLVVRQALTVYELDINKIQSVNGGIIVSAANGTSLSVTGTTIYFDEDNTSKQIQFVVDDYIRAQVWTGRGIGSYVGKVTAVHHDTTYGAAYITATTISGTPWQKMDLVQVGNYSIDARQNLIYITASDTNNPYIDMLAGVNDGSFAGKQKLRIGNLTGITDGDFGGSLTGYGLYANNVYLKGIIQIAASSTGYSNITDKPTTLAGINSSEGNKLTGIEAGANVTANHTAAAIASQGALATANSADFATQVSGAAKPANNATVGATWGTNMYNIPGRLADTAPDNSLSLTNTFMGFHATGTNWPIKIANDSGVGKFYAGDGANNYVDWNGTTLAIKGNITATAGVIGGFTIDPTEGLYSGSGATRVQMKAGAGFWAGATAIGDAPFHVTNAGALTATGIAELGTATAVYDSKASNVGIKNADVWENSYDGDSSGLHFNRIGYAGGTTHYRNFNVYDGKGNPLFAIQGSIGTVYVVNALRVDGNLVSNGGIDLTSSTSTLLSGRHVKVSGGSNITCTDSTSDMSGFSQSITPKGNKIYVSFSIPIHPTSVNQTVGIYINCGGTIYYTVVYFIPTVCLVATGSTIISVTPNSAVTVKMQWGATTGVQYLGSSQTYGVGNMSIIDLM